MTLPISIGLRTQIAIALGLAFASSLILLGYASLQLTDRAHTQQLQQSAQLIATAWAETLHINAPCDPLVTHLKRASLKSLGRMVAGFSILLPKRAPLHVGSVGKGIAGRAHISGGGYVEVWLRPQHTSSIAPLRRLLILYGLVSGGTILLLTYLVLTSLIVRPVERLTHAAEALASGRLHVRVNAEGAAEVVRLASSFNYMAEEIKVDKDKLEQRLIELEQTTTELRKTQSELVRSEKLASVGRLAAGVAHEIGNPLAAILGLVELLQGNGIPEQKRYEFLTRIHRETDRIHKIIRSLLDFARKGGSTAEDALCPIDLTQIVEEAVQLLAPQKNLQEITIERRFHENATWVSGIPHQLSQILLNLLINAVDAMKAQGHILIEVKQAEIANYTSLLVSDSGPGIPSEVLSTLFEPFVTTKPAGQGTGLGLAVSLALAEAMRGTLIAKNNAHGGATFEVRLPSVNPPANSYSSENA